jgi:hypothetical protein
MATTLKQILKELDPGYAGSRDLLNQQLTALPQQGAADIAGLDAKLAQANTDILSGARSRNLGFSGIPLAEQAKYAATEYAPAVARVKQGQESNRLGILESLNQLGRDQRGQAQGVYENYLTRAQQDKELAEQRRQFNMNYKLQQQQLAEQRRAASASGGGAAAGDYLSALMGGGGSSGGGRAAGTKAVMQQRKDGGFNFNIGGKAVSAATYAKATGTAFRTLLSQMAKRGDKGAKQALGFVGNDFGYDPRKVNAGIYNALAWDTGRKASAPKPQASGVRGQLNRAYGPGVMGSFR